MKKISVFLAGLVLFWCEPVMAVDAPKGSPVFWRPVVEYNDSGSTDPFESRIEPERAEDSRESAGTQPKQELDLTKFSVQGIISGSGIPCAIINGEVVKAGSMVSGAKIVKIDKTGITLLYQDETYVLLTPVQAQSLPRNAEKQGGLDEK